MVSVLLVHSIVGSKVLNGICCAGYWKDKVTAHSAQHVVPGDCNIDVPVLSVRDGLPASPSSTLSMLVLLSGLTELPPAALGAHPPWFMFGRNELLACFPAVSVGSPMVLPWLHLSHTSASELISEAGGF